MKTIELTEEHKSKLLEMCKVLFPEYEFIHFQEHAIIGAGWDFDFNNICFSKKSTSIFDIELNIHWFEFCHEYLVEKILGDYNLIFCNKKNHPVDYLYSEFRKLK